MKGDRASALGAWGVVLALALAVLVLSPRPVHAARRVPARAPSASSPIDVRDISLSSSGEGAILSVDLERATGYALFTLDDPARIVLDLRDARLGTGTHLPSAGGLIRTIRSGPRPHGGLRLVLQLDPAATGLVTRKAGRHSRSRAAAAPRARARWVVQRRHGAAQLIVTIGRVDAAAFAARPVITAGGDRTPAATGRSIDEAGRAAAPIVASRHITAQDDEDLRPVRAAHAPSESDRDVVIAVDAGHGGQDPGAIGRGGTEEKNVTLAIARALAARIDAEPGMRAVLTRDRDEFLPLRERIRRARLAKADLFVSVHADSIRDPNVSGASVYVLSEHGATDEAARWLASRENAADLMGGVSLADKDSTLASVLLDVAQSANISASMTAAQRVLGSLDQLGEVRKAQVQQAGFVVLKSPDIKSMLIETAYISNPADERRLRTPAQQERLAGAIFLGLRSYFEQYPPAGTRFAHVRGGAGAVLAGAATGAVAISP